MKRHARLFFWICVFFLFYAFSPETAVLCFEQPRAPSVESVERYASFAAAVTAIGSSTKTLVISSPKTVTARVTVPATLLLHFTGSGRLDLAAGVIITINSPPTGWPIQQIFGGSGTVSFSSNRAIRDIYPQWWGAKGDRITDDTTAIQNAITAAAGRIVYFPAGTYKITSGLALLQDNTTLTGAGLASTLSFSGIPEAPPGLIAGYIHVFRPNAVVQGVRIAHLHIKGDKPKTATNPNITLQTPNAIALGMGGASPSPSTVSNSYIEHNWIEGFPGEGIIITSGGSQYGENNTIAFNHLYDADGAGINAVSGNIIRAKILGNTLRNMNGIGIEWSADGALIANNVLTHIENSGISTESNTLQSLWTIIANNMLDNVGNRNGMGVVANGIQLGQSFGQKRVLVTGNTLTTIYGHGIVRTGNDANSSDILVTGNTVEGFGTTAREVSPNYGVGAVGIFLRNTARAIVANNWVRAVGGPRSEGEGVDVAGDSFMGSCHSNTVSGLFSSNAFLAAPHHAASAEETQRVLPACIEHLGGQ